MPTTAPSFVPVDVGPPQWKEGKSGVVTDLRGVGLRIETTNHCNFKCTFCPHPSHTRKRQFIDRGLFERVVKEAGELGLRYLDIRNFGEPLIDKRLPELVVSAKQSGFTTVLIHTNGYSLDATKLAILAESGMTDILLSMSPEREFLKTRPGTNYARLKKNIESLQGSPHKNLVTVDFINTGESSVDEIKEMKQWLTEIGLKIRVEIVLHNWAAGDIPASTKRFYCHRLWTSLTVLADGRVALCCLDYDGEVILGDLTTQTVSEVVNNPLYQEIRSAHLEGRFLSKCASCNMPLVKDFAGV